MKFVEISGAILMKLVDEDQRKQLHAAGVDDDSKIRVNRQGDIEILRASSWNVIGGLLGDYQHKIKKFTGLDWT